MQIPQQTSSIFRAQHGRCGDEWERIGIHLLRFVLAECDASRLRQEAQGDRFTCQTGIIKAVILSFGVGLGY